MPWPSSFIFSVSVPLQSICFHISRSRDEDQGRGSKKVVSGRCPLWRQFLSSPVHITLINCCQVASFYIAVRQLSFVNAKSETIWAVVQCCNRCDSIVHAVITSSYWQVVGGDIRGARGKRSDVLGSSIRRLSASEHCLRPGHTSHCLSDNCLQQPCQEDLWHPARSAR